MERSKFFYFAPDLQIVASVAWHLGPELLLLHFNFYVVYLYCQKVYLKIIVSLITQTYSDYLTFLPNLLPI